MVHIVAGHFYLLLWLLEQRLPAILHAQRRCELALRAQQADVSVLADELPIWNELSIYLLIG